MSTLQPLQPAQLQWDGDTPQAEAFGDIYFSRADGLAESRHVFLEGSRLRERWQALPPHATFVIGETGFGTGLNFLLACEQWQQCAPHTAELFFISTELYPLTPADLQRALAHWPSLAPLAATLLEQYPPLLPGFHWLRWPDARITLLLLFGDAQHTLPQLLDGQLLNGQHPDHTQHQPWQVDAWFLDGFAPACNPQLWQHNVLQHVAALSRDGTTLATFTAAGQVRRDLTTLGFTVTKVPGYGSKREMITAQYDSSLTTSAIDTGAITGTPWLLQRHRQPIPSHVAVIGGGLAGCHIARALAVRGVAVTLYEQHAAVAQEASGNPQGALYTKLSASDAALARFSLASLQYAVRHYAQPSISTAMHRCGLLQLQETCEPALQQLLANSPTLATWLTAAHAADTAGIPVLHGGWWLPHAGWMSPNTLCQHLLQHSGIDAHFNTDVADLQHVDGQWQLHDTQGHTLGTATQVVIASANHITRYPQTAWLPLRPVRGQITQLPTTGHSRALRCVVCAEGYLTPAHHGEHCLGASFVPRDTDTTLRPQEQQHNLGLLREIAPALVDDWLTAPLHGRAALRCTTPDHLPLAGPLPDRTAFLQDYAALRHNARLTIPAPGQYIPGLWLLGGFGGRGLCYIPLAAELLTSQLLHHPRPLPRDLQQALAPARFVIRELVKANAGQGV